eukprot:3661233-Rhodomonas_salina.2
MPNWIPMTLLHWDVTTLCLLVKVWYWLTDNNHCNPQSRSLALATPPSCSSPGPPGLAGSASSPLPHSNMSALRPQPSHQAWCAVSACLTRVRKELLSLREEGAVTGARLGNAPLPDHVQEKGVVLIILEKLNLKLHIPTSWDHHARRQCQSSFKPWSSCARHSPGQVASG